MDSKDTFFSDKQSLNCGGRLLQFNPALVMGILNITPDSFYAGSRYSDPEEIRKKVTEMVGQGADILDVGAYSSRPGAENVGEDEELERLTKAIPLIREASPGILISVDTFRSNVARRVVGDFGIDMINDISGGGLDTEMFSTIARLQVPYIIMHMKGNPSDMQEHAVYGDVVKEMITYFSEKISRLNQLGVNDIIIDPGFGFAKTTEHNFEILRQLENFGIFTQPLMVGISRKSMIYKTLDCSPTEALNGSTVLHTIALMKGASILRVHDVRAAREAVELVRKTMSTGDPDLHQDAE
ncbi:dihydropteroate synthase [Bacteroidota bacterium]